MRSKEEIEKRITMELTTIYHSPNEITSAACWHRARALAWILEKNSENDEWLRGRYEEVRKRHVDTMVEEMQQKIEEGLHGI